MIYNLLKEDAGPSFNVCVKNIVAKHCIYSNVPIKSPSSPHNFYSLCANMTHEAAHLLSKLLSWDPVSSNDIRIRQFCGMFFLKLW